MIRVRVTRTMSQGMRRHGSWGHKRHKAAEKLETWASAE